MGYTTYILGAGASANAIPPVNRMNIRIKELYELLKCSSRNNNFNEFKGCCFDDFESFLINFSSLIETLGNHFSVDTYAKKLYLTNDPQYKTIKELINLFILFEQLNIDELEKHFSVDYKNIVNERDRFLSSDEIEICQYFENKNLDQRYDVFLASIFDINLKWPDKFKIISYNYDNQLELAYSFYKGYLSSYTDLKIFSLSNNIKPNIVKLNGYAAFKSINNAQISSSFSISERFSANNIIQNVFNLYESLMSHDYKEDTNINFAWDKSEYSIGAMNKSKEILMNSDEIIIIGYSFPEFNRYADEELLSSFGLRTKIYIQTLADYEIVSSRLKQRRKNLLLKSITKVNYIDQFFIP